MFCPIWICNVGTKLLFSSFDMHMWSLNRFLISLNCKIGNPFIGFVFTFRICIVGWVPFGLKICLFLRLD